MPRSTEHVCPYGNSPTCGFYPACTKVNELCWLSIPSPVDCQCVAIPYGRCVLKFMHPGLHINDEGTTWP